MFSHFFVSCLFVPKKRWAGCCSQQSENVVRTGSTGISVQSPVTRCASSVPAMNQIHSEGSILLSSIYQAGFGRARCGFGTMLSSLGRPVEAIKHTQTDWFLLCFSYKQL